MTEIEKKAKLKENRKIKDASRDACPTYIKEGRMFIPSIMEELLDLPFGNKGKPLRKYKPATLLLHYFLNKCYTQRYLIKDKMAPISLYAISTICKGNKHTALEFKNWALKNDLFVTDGTCQIGLKAYYYALGKRLTDKSVTWTKTKEIISLTLPEPMKRDNKETAKTDVNITVDTELLAKSIDNVAELRGWDENAKNVWEWYLTDDFDLYYTETKEGRHYGKWARTPKELRGCFLIDGEPTVEPDLPNSHPTFLTMFYDLIEESDKEKAEYVKLVQSGVFYECIVKFGDIQSTVDQTARDIAKIMVMKFLGGCWKDSEVGVIKKFFAQLFPMLFTLMATVRSTKIHKSYKSINLALQELESDVIVDKICNEFNAVSLHDGVLCKTSDSDKINKRIEEIIKEKTGLTIKCKTNDKRKELVKNL